MQQNKELGLGIEKGVGYYRIEKRKCEEKSVRSIRCTN